MSVSRYIALSEFSRNEFIKGGIDAKKIEVIPNFLPKYLNTEPGKTRENYALYVGRLSPEKGILTMLQAWKNLSGIPLRIIGDGPMMDTIKDFVLDNRLSNVELLGQQTPEAVYKVMKEARVLIFPSEVYETFGRVAMEAFAAGLPVVGSRIGAIQELLQEGKTGLLFTPGDPADIVAKIEWAWSHPEEVAEMGRAALQEYEQKYTPEIHYQKLMALYQKVTG